AVARMPVPVLTGIGHETDRSIADEVAAISEKTPTAAAEWLIAAVADFAGRIERAREVIGGNARTALDRSQRRLVDTASRVGATRATLAREHDRLEMLRQGIVDGSRSGLRRQHSNLDRWAERFASMGVEETLRRGFAVVTREDGTVINRGGGLRRGERVRVRFSDGTVGMIVEGPDE